MINITERGAADPDAVTLTAGTAISFRAESDAQKGEGARVYYDLGQPSELVFEDGRTSISTAKHFPGQSTVITHPVTLRWRDEGRRRRMLVTVLVVVDPDDPEGFHTRTTATLVVE